MLTQEDLKSEIFYNKETGKFYRNRTSGGRKKGSKAGAIDSKGYLQIRVKGRLYLAHRLAWLYVKGYWPENIIDHIDRNPKNNKWCNLREVSKQCNIRNCNIRKDSTSGVTGVSYNKYINKYSAYICVNKKHKVIGYYEDFKEAVMMRWKEEVRVGWNHCNKSSSAFLYLKDKGLI